MDKFLWILVLALLVSPLVQASTEIHWTSATCGAHWIDKKSLLGIECAIVDAPLFYSDYVEGGNVLQSKSRNMSTIPLLVWRLQATSKVHINKAIWLLEGGPGSDASSLLPLMHTLFNLYRGQISVYTIDHRGTGQSNFVGCTSVLPLRECFEEVVAKGYELDAFTVTNAARDLHFVIQLFNKKEDVYVYAVSYGTFVLERFLVLYPEVIKGAILDSPIAQGRMRTIMNQNLYERPGLRMLQACKEDEFCRSKLDDPEKQLRELYSKITQGHCPQVTRMLGKEPVRQLKEIFGLLLKDDDSHSIPHLLYRYYRCRSVDIAYISNWLRKGAAEERVPNFQSKVQASGSSAVVHDLIAFSELYDKPPRKTISTIPDPCDNALFCVDDTETSLQTYCTLSGWNEPNCWAFQNSSPGSTSFIYEDDRYVNLIAKAPEKGGVMILSGGFDAATPQEHAEYLFRTLSGNRRLYSFKYFGHDIESSSKLPHRNISCAVILMRDFINYDTDFEQIDTSCIKEVQLQTAGFKSNTSWDGAHDFVEPF